MAEERKEAFLERWSRRKRKAGAVEHDVSDAQPAVSAAEPIAPEDETVRVEMEANRRAAEAVDIDALRKGDDFSVFFKRGVPQALKNQALRKLWRTNPVLANLDGLNDYDTDFNDPSANVYTSLWQAGRGYLSADEENPPATKGKSEAAVANAEEGRGNEAHALSGPEIEETASSQKDADSEPEALAELPAEETGGPEEPVASPRRRVSIRRRLVE